jgi:urease gamma subunit
VANYQKILELVLEGRSYNEIVESAGCSRRDVSVVKKTVTARGITAGLAESMTDTDVQALFPDGRKRVSVEHESPDYAAVLRAMIANRHFTLQQAWRMYASAGGQGKKCGYSQYGHLSSASTSE